jgi:MarR family transcriptional regulator, transcriptional regulator for hemolysin
VRNPRNPTQTFGFLLKDLSRLYVQRFEQRAAVHGLTLPQCRALVYLAGNEAISQVQLAEFTDIEPMSLVRILDRMEAEGLVERRNDPADRRARCLYLKPKAKPLIDEIWQLVEVTRREAFAGIPKKQSELLTSLLAQVQANFLSLEPLPVKAPAPPQNTRVAAAPQNTRVAAAAPLRSRREPAH